MTIQDMSRYIFISSEFSLAQGPRHEFGAGVGARA